MPGFVAVINTQIKIAPSTEQDCLCNSLKGTKFTIEHRPIRKFANDKFMFETDEYVYLLDGVIFNNHQLMEKYRCADWKDCVVEMHRKDSFTFYNEFRGSFMGLVYNKRQNSWIFYTDHVGDKQIFCSKLKDGGWIIGSEMSYIVNTMRLNNLKMTPNRDAAYMAITIGFVIENNTLVKEITKLIAGHYWLIKSDEIKEYEYHSFNNTPIERSKEEMIEEIDRRFRNAVKLQFEKDKEYGYKHMACLSGGLDSRMTVWVAHQMGYTNQLNLTFCQSNYTDFKVAQEIATDLRHDFMFKALDGGNCLYEIDTVSKLSYGMACYFGLSHTYSMFGKLKFHDYGVIHSGMIGDVVLGSYVEQPVYGPAKLSDGAHSLEMMDRLKEYKFKYSYDNAEIYMMQNRGFGFCGQGALAYGHSDTETFSPFYDVEFMEYCFSIPLEWRCEHKIYFEWLMSKYPQAGNYIWEKKGASIPSVLMQQEIKSKAKHYVIRIAGMSIPTPQNPYFLEYLKGFVLRRLGIRKKVGKQTVTGNKRLNTFMIQSNNHMNPIDYWYYNNPDLKAFMDGYWETNKHIIKDEQLLKDMTYLYEDCKATFDKLQPLTVLAAYKLIWQ